MRRGLLVCHRFELGCHYEPVDVHHLARASVMGYTLRGQE